VPFKLSGPLQLIATQNLGPLGPTDGQPVVFDWTHTQASWRWLLPWLLLAALLARPVNRCRSAWAILIPLCFIQAVLYACDLTDLSGFANGMGAVLLRSLSALSFGLAALWLNGDLLARYSRAHGLFHAIILLIFAGIFLLPTSAALASSDVRSFGAMYSIAGTGLLVVLGLAGRCCRRKLGYWRFGLILSLLIFGLTLISFCSIMAWLVLHNSVPVPYLAILLSISSAALCVTLAIQAIVQPFMILAFANRFYRARLTATVQKATAAARPADQDFPPPNPLPEEDIVTHV
jgi:hypothetical protein